ncbi:hypothetical protein NQ317_008609 [Molorchus minor]|uniref:Uncharacterized protein n=1 Tax=Molorchus minor TaxID=1323400 RepID=A0ABQ9JB80_9CUCU|nr:hypothetical protein NQ317_008609 [Molorchus minor]
MDISIYYYVVNECFSPHFKHLGGELQFSDVCVNSRHLLQGSGAGGEVCLGILHSDGFYRTVLHLAVSHRNVRHINNQSLVKDKAFYIDIIIKNLIPGHHY